jgi:excisionase family DNA binding protein
MANRELRSLTTQQAAKHRDVSRRTMLRWVKSGKIPSFQTPGGRQRILPADLAKFTRQQGIPVPRELLNEPGRRSTGSSSMTTTITPVP